MSSLIIVKPERIASVTSGGAMAFTPDPKEALAVPAGGLMLVADYGRQVSIDTAYAGYHTAAGAQGWTVSACDSAGNVSTALGTRSLAPLGLGTPYHSIIRSGVLTSQYFRFDLTANGGAYLIGVLALGRSFQPTYGHEYGGGRLVTDTGTATRLFGGGFGIDEGVRATGWQWTMGDLTDAEVRTLYQMARELGTTRTALIVEDPDLTDGLNERIQWGLISKFDAYERFAPGATRWSLRVDDWA